jgi:hypothetical protein
MANLKDRLAKLEAQTRPLAIDAWFEMACKADPKNVGVNFPICLHLLCEWEVLIQPSPLVWSEFDGPPNFAQLSDEELREMAREIVDAPEQNAAAALLYFETFRVVPRHIHAPDASKKLAECLRYDLEKVRADAAQWDGFQIERLMLAVSEKLTALHDATGSTTESDALDFILNFQMGEDA